MSCLRIIIIIIIIIMVRYELWISDVSKELQYFLLGKEIMPILEYESFNSSWKYLQSVYIQ
jgi:hypothetical protein